MSQPDKPGTIVILNGVPRSGKSSIATAIQDTFAGLWMNLGVDIFMKATSKRYLPGMGLRPGGEAQDVEAFVPRLYAALYESVAAHSRLGLNVVVDIGHHDAYATPRHILADSARRMSGLPVLFVGVRCPIDVVLRRRRDTWGEAKATGDDVIDAVHRWEREVHVPGVYDLEVDTSLMSPAECAEAIRRRLESGPKPTAFRRLASMATEND